MFPWEREQKLVGRVAKKATPLSDVDSREHFFQKGPPARGTGGCIRGY